MAARLVVALALVGLCASAPQYRIQRSYSIGQAYNAAGGASSAQANANPNSAQAFGSTNGGQLLYARNGYYYPGQALAQAQTYEPAAIPTFGGAKAIAQAQNGADLLVLPAPTPIAYQQNLELPQQPLQPGAILAQSSALNNGASEVSNSFASSNGAGVAESSANTQGLGLGQTTSNAKTYGGAGFADSNAKTGYGLTSSSARTQGQGSAASVANINEPLYPAVPVATPIEVVPVAPAVIDAKSPIFQAYVPANQAWPQASSNANVIGAGQASSLAKISDNSRLTDGRTISWRFGTLYEAPGSAQAQANSNGLGSAKSAANINGYGNAQSSANTNGSGSANANTNTNSGLAYYAKAAEGAWNPAWNYGGRTSADAQSNGSGNANSFAGLQGLNAKVANSQANSSGFGSAQAKAQTA